MIIDIPILITKEVLLSRKRKNTIIAQIENFPFEIEEFNENDFIHEYKFSSSCKYFSQNGNVFSNKNMPYYKEYMLSKPFEIKYDLLKSVDEIKPFLYKEYIGQFHQINYLDVSIDTYFTDDLPNIKKIISTNEEQVKKRIQSQLKHWKIKKENNLIQILNPIEQSFFLNIHELQKDEQIFNVSHISLEYYPSNFSIPISFFKNPHIKMGNNISITEYKTIHEQKEKDIKNIISSYINNLYNIINENFFLNNDEAYSRFKNKFHMFSSVLHSSKTQTYDTMRQLYGFLLELKSNMHKTKLNNIEGRYLNLKKDFIIFKIPNNKLFIWNTDVEDIINVIQKIIDYQYNDTNTLTLK